MQCPTRNASPFPLTSSWKYQTKRRSQTCKTLSHKWRALTSASSWNCLAIHWVQVTRQLCRRIAVIGASCAGVDLDGKPGPGTPVPRTYKEMQAARGDRKGSKQGTWVFCDGEWLPRLDGLQGAMSGGLGCSALIAYNVTADGMVPL